MKPYLLLYVVLAVVAVFAIGHAYDYAITHANPCVGSTCK